MKDHKKNNGNYKKFGLMLAASFVVMYAVMFLNADQFDHVMLSTTRTYMTILMIAPMALLKLIFMGSMYKNKKLNLIIGAAAFVMFVGALQMLRNQTLIKDIQYMKAMIPHHSSAIMTSQNATFEDPEVKKLAEDIIKAQKREIAQMKQMIERLEQAEKKSP